MEGKEMGEKQKLIDQILNIELEMFLRVRSRQKSSCQDHPDSFRLHREAQFSVWAKETLKSYLYDLHRAVESGMNFMTYKYARMEELVPQMNNNPVIDKIIALQYRWQQEIFQHFPNLMEGARPLSRVDDSAGKTSFETYLRCELETYSDHTLSLLYEDMHNKENKGVNMSAEVYEHLVKKRGYSSIEEAEKHIKEKKNSRIN
jgi:hypothetical protein